MDAIFLIPAQTTAVVMEDFLRGRVVTIVDDDQSIRAGLSNLLRSHGIQAFCFSSASEFLASIHLPDCECLITDVRMPGMGGLELLDELRRQSIYIPIILISAYASRSVSLRVASGEVVCFIEKPFDAHAIEAGLAAVFRPTILPRG